MLDHRGILPSNLPQIVISRRNAPDILLVHAVIDQYVLVILDQLQSRILELGELGMRQISVQAAYLF